MQEVKPRYEEPYQDQKKGEDFKNYPQITPKTVALLAKQGINSMFAIQYRCFDPIYEGRDLIGRDLTGSGKTLAFVLPIVEHLRQERLLG